MRREGKMANEPKAGGGRKFSSPYATASDIM